MEVLVLLALAVVVCGAVGGAVLWRRRRIPEKEPPPRAWASETVTPVMMGPRNKAPERVARRFVVDQGALLALKMAAVDGTITDDERAVVRRFVVSESRGLDAREAEAAIARAEGSLDNPIQVENAIEGLRALGSEEQRQLLIELFVDVAQADGAIRDEEVSFMQRVGAQLGLSPDDVKKRIALS
jgi:uncharacterized tellurite resistance protein B-like protein